MLLERGAYLPGPGIALASTALRGVGSVVPFAAVITGQGGKVTSKSRSHSIGSELLVVQARVGWESVGFQVRKAVLF